VFIEAVLVKGRSGAIKGDGPTFCSRARPWRRETCRHWNRCAKRRAMTPRDTGAQHF
jgi:hypothetical protein